MVLEIFIFLILDYIASIATTKQNIKTDTNVLLSSINVMEIALSVSFFLLSNVMEIALSGVLLSSVKCHGNRTL
jgi:hypothetical protein